MGIAERKEREFKRREREILDAASRLFDRDDWQLVSIERIAQEAEIGKGTVYLHFPSKEAIYGRLTLEFARGVLERLRGIEPALSAVDRLRQALRIFFDAHREGQGCQRVVEYCQLDDFRRRLDEATRAELQGVDDEIMALIHDILRDGIARGTFVDRPLEVLVLGAHATMAGAVRIFNGACACAPESASPHLRDPELFVEEITRFVLAGLMFQDRVSTSGGDATAEADRFDN